MKNIGSSYPTDTWPDLPTTGFVSGRLAEEVDLRRGDAVFLTATGGVSAGEPVAIAIPQYAFLVDEDGSRVPVVVVQAEANERGTFFRLRDAQAQEYVVTAAEVILLGQSHP
jgi:hypothetical protein